MRLPCAYAGLSARIAQQVGFPAVAFSGNAVSANLLCAPDVETLSSRKRRSGKRTNEGAVLRVQVNEGPAGNP